MKISAINKNQSAVLITLLVLIFLGAGYFFIYLPQNERRIKEQRFNALQNVDRNIHTKIENSIALLNNLLSSYQKADTAERKKLKEYINQYSSANFKLTPLSSSSLSKKELLTDSLDLDSTYTIVVNNNTREINLSFSKHELSNKNEKWHYQLGMTFSFKQFIQFLLPVGVFDEYIVFSKERPVYETFPSGISNVKEDSLLGAKNGVGSAVVRNQEISGIEYKMFLQPIGLNASNEWIIDGLLTDKHYQNEKNQLPTRMVLLLSIILVVCMVAFPWLKLYQMGSKDRLTIKDGIASVFISMILVSLMFFIFFDQNFPFRPLINKDAKSSLANGIYKSFKSEIDTAYRKLEQFDSLVMVTGRSGKLNRDIVNLNDDSPLFADGEKLEANKQSVIDARKGLDINQVFWLDKNGSEIINWTADEMNAPHGEYKGRDYYKKINDGREYILDSNGNKRFYIDQLISWTSGTFRSVISMKSKNKLDSLVSDSPFVAVLSFNFKSLRNVVLPTGYLFAITDNSGKVLYHSDPSRNLNENLLNIFSKATKLKSCLDASAGGRFVTKYWGKDYEVDVKPINGLPYFVIIFEETVYTETRDMEIYSFTFSMLIFFFGYLLLNLLAIFLVSAKRSFFKKQLFDTSWIGPKISSHSEYVLASLFNIFIILLLIFLLNRTSFLQFLFILLFAVTVIPLFLNSIFAERYFKEKSNVFPFKKLAKYCLWTFIVFIDIIAIKLLANNNIIGLLGYQLLMIIGGVGLYSIRKEVYSIACQMKTSKRFKGLFGRWNYVHSFTFMMLTRLIVTSGIPIIFFYIVSYNYEQNLAIRYQQIDFANRLLNKFQTSASDKIIPPGEIFNGVYFDSSVINPFTLITRSEALKESGMNYTKQEDETAEEGKTIQLLKMFRLYLTDKATTEDKFYSNGATDSSFFFNPFLDEVYLKDKGTVSYRKAYQPGQYLRIESEDHNYHHPTAFEKNKFDGALFWLLLTGALVIFYFVIHSIIKKLFALSLPDLQIWKQLDSEILTNKNWDQPLFVIGLPGSGKKKFLLDKIEKGELKMDDGSRFFINEKDLEKNNVFVADLINVPSTGNEAAKQTKWDKYIKNVFNDNNQLIIVNHFEYNIKDPITNRYKLEFLERLFLESKFKIVILSTIHPVAFLDSAMEHIVRVEDRSIPGQDLERWHVLLGHYRILVLPLQLHAETNFQSVLKGSLIQKGGSGVKDATIRIVDSAVEVFSNGHGKFILPEQPSTFAIKISLEGYISKTVEVTNSDDLLNIELEHDDDYYSALLIRHETNHTYFLKKLQEPAFVAGKNFTEETRIAKFDELAFKFQVSSHYFYMYIWQSLTKEEKFLLYDLAEDNLVNSFDDYNLSMLLAKGVVVNRDGTLRLFNKGFRNFILSAIGNSEAMKIKNQIKENGNWNTLKIPLQLVILAILAFLLTSQEEAFAKLITYVAALGAAVPAVLKLFSLFDKSSQKES